MHADAYWFYKLAGAAQRHRRGGPNCSATGHERMKTPSKWPRLKPIGRTFVPPSQEGPAYWLEQANCRDCGTTLGIEVPAAPGDKEEDA